MDRVRFSPSVLVATLGGLGFLTRMPGTLGSAVAALFFALCPVPWWGVLALAVVGTWASGRAEILLGGKDPGAVVVDEVLGMWLSLYALPPSFVLPGFLLFRVVDILKPFPVCAAERLPGGFGVMADDAVGGVMVNLVLQAARGWLWREGWLYGLLTYAGR